MTGANDITKSINTRSEMLSSSTIQKCDELVQNGAFGAVQSNEADCKVNLTQT